MKRKLLLFKTALKLLLITIFYRPADHWAFSPIQGLLQFLNSNSRTNPKLRRLNFFVGTLLKYRELNNHDKSVMVKNITGLKPEELNKEISHCELHFKSQRPEMGPTLPIQLVIKLDANSERPLDFLSSTIGSRGIQNVSLIWQSTKENFDEKTLLPFVDRRPEEFRKVNFNHTMSFKEPGTANVLWDGNQRKLPAICLSQANQFQKTVLGNGLTVCIYLPENASGFSDAALKKWIASAKSYLSTSEEVHFLSLNKISPSKSTLNLLARNNVKVVRALGVDDFGAMGLAATCDIFLGSLSEFSLIAAGYERPGIYFIEGHGVDHHNNEKQQWFLNDVDYKNATTILKKIIARFRAKTTKARNKIPTNPAGKMNGVPISPQRNRKKFEEVYRVTEGWEKRIINSKFALKSELKETITLYIDIFGHCNLRCPSCPVGNWAKNDGKPFSSGLIEEEKFRLILEKSLAESSVSSVGLFNWTEPLLNPNASKFVRIVKSYDLNCSISSNLNVLRDPMDLMESGLDWLRVSVSGFGQEIYKKNHVGGDIEVVKNNMKRLSEAKEKTGATTDLELFFHKYKDNEHEEEPMRQFATSLGFRFSAAWAYLMPVEKMLSIYKPNEPLTTLTEDDFRLVDRLALEPKASLEITRKHKVKDCNLFDFLTIDINANLFICCASSGSPTNIIGNYLELSMEQIRERQAKHSLCGPCMKAGLPILYGHADEEFDSLGKFQRDLYQNKTSARKRVKIDSGKFASVSK